MSVREAKFSDLPENIRVKLSGEGEKELWHRVDEFGGVKSFSEAFGISSSKLYNWKNSEVFLPVEVVRRVMGSEAADDVIGLKGGGRSLAIKDPDFPLEVSDELLTRMDCSVVVDERGVPVYQANDRGNLERFAELLSGLGAPFQVYSRSIYELRYPKYIHEIFSRIEFDSDLGALVDEKGRIENGMVKAGDRKIPVDEFEEELFSRQKRYQLYVARGDSEKLAELLGEEASRVENLG